jgi:hypothetical protein
LPALILFDALAGIQFWLALAMLKTDGSENAFGV